MPIASFSAEQAFANHRANRQANWPDGRRNGTRLDGVASVGFSPGFTLAEGEPIFTVGSCFARNIETRLQELGFDVPARQVYLPSDERITHTANDILNKYAPPSILNEFRWALDPQAAFPEDAYLQVGEDRWHDPHLAGNTVPASLERVRERRAMVAGLYAQLPRCRVIVITLGLIEAWYDTKVGLHLNEAPPQAAYRREPERFRLDILSVADVREALEGIYALLEQHGHPDFRLLVTVSPVPLKTTFTEHDAIWANTYGKAAQRAAVEEFARAHPRVDYFPSFEIVTHTLRDSAYLEDNRHVASEVIHTIVDRVAESYFGAVAEPEAMITPTQAIVIAREVKSQRQLGDFNRVVKLLGSLKRDDRYKLAGFDEFEFRYEFGCALMRVGMTVAGDLELARAVALQPSSALANFNLGHSRARLGRNDEAEQYLRRAVEIAPNRPMFKIRLGRQLIHNQRFAEAERLLTEALESNPDQEEARRLLAEAQTLAPSPDDEGGADAVGWLKRLVTLGAGRSNADPALAQAPVPAGETSGD